MEMSPLSANFFCVMFAYLKNPLSRCSKYRHKHAAPLYIFIIQNNYKNAIFTVLPFTYKMKLFSLFCFLIVEKCRLFSYTMYIASYFRFQKDS